MMTDPLGRSGPGKGRLLVLTGIDGAGKSTVLSLLAQEYPHWEVASYNPRSWLSSDAHPHLGWMLEQDPRGIVGRLAPAARASFLGHMVLCHWESWLQPRLASGATVLMDSFFFRFWARERAWGGEWYLLERIVCNLPTAECAVLLKVRPEIAVSRKSEFDPCETGGAGEPAGERAAFIQFQEKVGLELRTACQQWSHRLVVIAGDQSPEQVAGEVANALAVYEGSR